MKAYGRIGDTCEVGTVWGRGRAAGSYMPSLECRVMEIF